MQINVIFWSLGKDVMIQLLFLIALKSNYFEFILIVNSPLTITSRNFAKKLPAYPPIWINNKLRILLTAFITSQFKYRPLVWMFHNRQLNKKINKIQERALRITYKDAGSNFSDLLQKDCAVTIHTKNLQILMTEMYKTRNDLKLSIMQEMFCENTTHYNLCNNDDIYSTESEISQQRLRKHQI